jgi:uncharacterized protein YcnI
MKKEAPMHSHDKRPACRAIALGLLLAAARAGAHVGLVATPARTGEPVRLALQVGHGCGDSPTTTLVVQVPEGLLLARPLAKPGWNISTQARTLEAPYLRHGLSYAANTSSIRWEGGTLPSHLADEFVFNAIVADGAGGSLVLRVQQACQDGQKFDWNGPPESAEPAPVLAVEPGAGHRH